MGVVVRVYCREIRGFKVNIMVRVSNMEIRLGEITDPRTNTGTEAETSAEAENFRKKELNHFRISEKSVDARKKR